MEIPRLLVRRFAAVLRRGLTRAARSSLMVEFRTGAEGFVLRAHHTELSLTLHEPGVRDSEMLVLPLERLADFQGKGCEPVQLLHGADGTIEARWQDGGVPQVVEYPASEVSPVNFPAPPEQFAVNPAAMLGALAEAAQTCARDATGYAVHCLQLRGRAGEIVATDCRQLLVQRGWEFPWKEDVLVPRLGLFASRELAGHDAVQIGRTEQYVVLQTGPWTLWMPIDATSRYPFADQVIPRAEPGATRLHLDSEDAACLVRSLPRLPGQEDDGQPVTLDVNGQITVRAKASDQSRMTEVLLSRSRHDGPEVRCVVDRQYLARALELGLREFVIHKPEAPIRSDDAQRTMVWAPLGASDALAPDPHALRIVSSESTTTASSASSPIPQSERKVATMNTVPDQSANGNDNHGSTVPQDERPAAANVGLAALITESEALRDVLHGAASRAQRLHAALKRYRKQSRLMQATLANLRQLQTIEA